MLRNIYTFIPTTTLFVSGNIFYDISDIFLILLGSLVGPKIWEGLGFVLPLCQSSEWDRIRTAIGGSAHLGRRLGWIPEDVVEGGQRAERGQRWREGHVGHGAAVRSLAAGAQVRVLGDRRALMSHQAGDHPNHQPKPSAQNHQPEPSTQNHQPKPSAQTINPKPSTRTISPNHQPKTINLNHQPKPSTQTINPKPLT